MIFIQLLLIPLVILGLAVGFLRYILKRNLGSASSHLQELTQDCTQKLEEAKKQKEEANKYYTRTVAKAKDEGDQARQGLIQEGQKIREEMIEQARKQGEEITNRARATAESMLAEVEQRIDAKAMEKTHSLIQELLPGKMSEETHAHWVAALIQNKFEALSRLNVSDQAQEARVVTAFPLKPDEKKMLAQELSKKLGRPLQLIEEVDPAALLGVRILIENLIIDGTLQLKIQESLRETKSQHASSR